MRPKLIVSISAAALMAAAAPNAYAGRGSEFIACDGLNVPEAAEYGMRDEKGLAGILSTILGSASFSPAAQPQAIIASCDIALNNPLLTPEMTLRRANLLRARGAAHLLKGESAEAISDFDAAQAAAGPLADDILVRRSLGVSLKQLKAIALNQLNQKSEASQLADTAANERPYAKQVQVLAAFLLMDAGGDVDAIRKRFAALDRLAPGFSKDTDGIIRENAFARGDFVTYSKMDKKSAVKWPEPPTIEGNFSPTQEFLTENRHIIIDECEENAKKIPGYIRCYTNDSFKSPEKFINDTKTALETRLSNFQSKLMDNLKVNFKTAYVEAALGNVDKSNSLIQETISKIESYQLPMKDGETDIEKAFKSKQKSSFEVNKNILLSLVKEGVKPIVDARIAITQGKRDEAIASLKKAILVPDWLRGDLVRALGEENVSPSRSDNRITTAKSSDNSYIKKVKSFNLPPNLLIPQSLMPIETPRTLVDYGASKTNVPVAMMQTYARILFPVLFFSKNFKNKKGHGFEIVDNADGTVSITSKLNTASLPMGQEISTLSAAKVTESRGKKGFVFLDRSEHGTVTRVTRGGVDLSEGFTDFEGTVKIRLLDDPASDPMAFDAMKVIDDLGPIYFGPEDVKADKQK